MGRNKYPHKLKSSCSLLPLIERAIEREKSRVRRGKRTYTSVPWNTILILIFNPKTLHSLSLFYLSALLHSTQFNFHSDVLMGIVRNVDIDILQINNIAFRLDFEVLGPFGINYYYCSEKSLTTLIIQLKQSNKTYNQ